MPGEVVKKLRDRRLHAWEEAKKLADFAAEENRNFSGEEQETWDKLNSELDALDKRITAMLDGEKRAAAQSNAWDELVSGPRKDGGKAESRAEADGKFAEELRSYLKGERGRAMTVPPPGGPIDMRVLTTATATSGAGLTVPTSFYNRLLAHVIEGSGVLQAGPTILNTNSGEAFTIPKTVTHTVPTAVVAEAAGFAVTQPTFGQTTLGAFKYGVLLQLSRELIDDTGVDLQGYLAMQAGRALGNYFGSHLVTGAGDGNQPRGILTDGTLGVTTVTGTGGVPSAQNLIELCYSVISPYRSSRSCGWLMKDSTIGAIRGLVDLNGQFLWQPSLQIGTPDTLLGKPIYADAYMPTAATGEKSVLFGDFSQYYVRMVGGIRFERSDDVGFANDLVSFRTILRADGALVDLHGALKWAVGAQT